MKYRLVVKYTLESKLTITKPTDSLYEIRAEKLRYMNDPKVKIVWVEYFEDNKWVSQV